MQPKSKNYYYALVDVLQSCSTIVTSWTIAQKYLSSHKCIIHKFVLQSEAESWTKKMCSRVKTNAVFKDAVFFDAGTSRLSMVEARITDNEGNSVMHEVVNKYFLNDKGNLSLDWIKHSNNFGELMACCLALKYAIKYKKKFIYGDSAITIFFWLCSEYNSKLDLVTIALIKHTCLLLKVFEEFNGTVMYISRERNRADLFYLA